MQSIRTIEKEVFNYLNNGLDTKLVYHCSNHTKAVYTEIQRIIDYERIKKPICELMKIAALCHDVGFVKAIENNEPFGAEYAEMLMKQLNYSQKDIEFVKRLILETDPNVSCTDLYSKCLNDADLGYLGKKEFPIWSEKLFKEYTNFNLIEKDRHKWRLKEIEFFEKHQFYSTFSNFYRRPIKEKNLIALKEALNL